jgi:hypothetical protein
MPARNLPTIPLPTDIGPPPHSPFLRILLFAVRRLIDGLVQRLDSGPFHLASYTVATLPPAANFAGALVYVSDGGVGQMLRYSDGTNWISAG